MSTFHCPVCGEPFDVAGPDGILVHILELHTETKEARWVVGQLSRLADADLEKHGLRASEPVG